MEWFKIDWRGPYPVETAKTKLEANGFGVYAIFELKGKTSKLIYIGETYWQKFGTRLQQHKREWFHKYSGRMVVHFGTIGLPQGKRISHEKVLDVESALIYIHTPPINTGGKRGYLGREIIIFNLGKIGTLERLICHKELHTLLKSVKTAL